MNTFREKLQEIRTEEEAKVRNRIPLTDDQLGLNDGTERCLSVRAEIVKFIEQLMNDFIGEAPAFSTQRGFFEGKYSIGMSCEEVCVDEKGELRKFFSRVQILLDPCTNEEQFTIVSKTTVWNRDLPKADVKGSLTREADVGRFHKFVESEMLRFAKEYFQHRRPSPPPAVTSAS